MTKVNHVLFERQKSRQIKISKSVLVCNFFFGSTHQFGCYSAKNIWKFWLNKKLEKRNEKKFIHPNCSVYCEYYEYFHIYLFADFSHITFVFLPSIFSLICVCNLDFHKNVSTALHILHMLWWRKFSYGKWRVWFLILSVEFIALAPISLVFDAWILWGRVVIQIWNRKIHSAKRDENFVDSTYRGRLNLTVGWSWIKNRFFARRWINFTKC